MNPYLIIGFVLALALAGAGGYFKGSADGVNKQKVADQIQFDKINSDLTAQKTEANAKYRAAADAVIALQAERDSIKTKLENEHVQNQTATAALRAQLADRGLRFAAAKAPGCGDGGGSAKGAEGAAAGAAASVVIQLPDKVASDLRQLAFDADQLRDDYRLCYDYAQVAK